MWIAGNQFVRVATQTNQNNIPAPAGVLTVPANDQNSQPVVYNPNTANYLQKTLECDLSFESTKPVIEDASGHLFAEIE